MQFVSMEVNRALLGKILTSIETDWRRSVQQQLTHLLPVLRYGKVDSHTIQLVTDISTTIARVVRSKGLLTTCTISEDRLLTINIPTSSDEYYQIRVQPELEYSRLQVSMFYPSSSDASAAMFYGPIAAKLTYEHGLGKLPVVTDGEKVTVAAWNAMCAMCAAQGRDGVVGILMDMARDGEI